MGVKMRGPTLGRVIGRMTPRSQGEAVAGGGGGCGEGGRGGAGRERGQEGLRETGGDSRMGEAIRFASVLTSVASLVLHQAFQFDYNHDVNRFTTNKRHRAEVIANVGDLVPKRAREEVEEEEHEENKRSSGQGRQKRR